MLNALKNLFSKLFPKKLATETTAELPTPTPVFEEPIKVTDYEITIVNDKGFETLIKGFTEHKLTPLQQEEQIDQTAAEQVLVDQYLAPVETVEEPVVEEVKPKRARDKGKFAPDDKLTEEYNEAWVGGKSPAKKNNKKKKK
jgi:hypothetical protein